VARYVLLMGQFTCFWEAELSFIHLTVLTYERCFIFDVFLIHPEVYNICSGIAGAMCYCSSVECQRWTGPEANTNYGHGQGNAATSLQACQTACTTTTGCNGVDWVTTAAQGSQCWLSGTWSSARGTATGTNHYVYNPNCAGKKFYSLL